MRLETYIAEQGLTQGEFAKLAGLTAATVSRLCNAIHEPTSATLRLIQRATGGKVTVEDFGTRAAE